MDLSLAQIIGFSVVIVTQIGQTVKVLAEINVLKSEIANLSERINRQNGRIDRLEEQEIEHIKEFHTKK